MKLLGVLLFLVACAQNSHNHANKHMHKKSHDELLARFEDPSRDSWQKPQETLNLIGDLSNKTVVDIGSGGGYFSKFFIQRSKKLIAADVDQYFLDFIKGRFRQYPNTEYRLIAYDDPKLLKQEVDVAFTCNTYHHIDHRVEYFKKVFIGLKDQGKVVIVDFKKTQDAQKIGPPLAMRVEMSQVIEELQAAGFEIVLKDTQVLEYQYIVIGQKTKKLRIF